MTLTLMEGAVGAIYSYLYTNIAAKLNVLIGNRSDCVDDTIDAADAWMVDNPLGSGVKGSSKAWKMGEPIHWTLDQYNNGLLCAPARD